MSNGYLQELFADRIGGREYGKKASTYKFARIKQAKAEAKNANPDTPLVDMGVGEPDEMAYPQVVKALQNEVEKPENRGYSDNGGVHFKETAARYMQNVFGVELDPATEVIHSIGSKTALSMLPAAFINPGDAVLMTVPGYPVFGTHAKYYGGEVYEMPLHEKNGFLPDLQSVPADTLERAKVMVLNYPNNPTGASATRAFFEEAVAFARENKLLIIQDAAYAALVFEEKPLSILQIPGAKEISLELHTLSKGFNMTGWRIGWVCGDPLLVKAYGDIKDNSDSGQFLPIQHAAATALDHPEITEDIAAKYSRRMDMLVKVLNQAGFQATKPKGSFFLYVKAPQSATRDGHTESFDSAEAFSQWMIRNLLISTVPWDEAGAFIRFSVTFEAKDESDEKKVIELIANRLAECTFNFHV